MTDIKPRIVDGVGYCSDECQHHFVFHKAHFCKLIDYGHGDLDCNACPIHARLVAEERDRLAAEVRLSHDVLAGIVAATPPDTYPDAEALINSCDGVACDPLLVVAEERDHAVELLEVWHEAFLDPGSKVDLPSAYNQGVALFAEIDGGA